MEKDILNIIAFCILMENDGGILDKSPDYVKEKFKRYSNGKDNEWMWGLDENNFQKLKEWAKKWQKRDLDDEIMAYEEAKKMEARAYYEAMEKDRSEWEYQQELERQMEWEYGQSIPEEPPY
jgi:hypothetical protein